MSGRIVRRYSDVALAALVVGIIAMMIIPLPTQVLDILLATNISLAVVVLLASIYITEPIRIATFPTLLLITTLFRLGLNVSSTRLILLQADAGEVIRSFGEFVVAGNLVVGIIVFLILTLIQFVVIAKGSERVAEVAARFNLDAMPGKQMSIDADLRAGIIDHEEARGRRRALERESQLYGSMDGAMKFVKGDAIAGIVITLINIVGGLVVGVYQMGMSAGEAASVYSLLTIGDGLVSQIPALVISTSAGLVVTRVASEEESSHLGQDIASQLLGQPKAIAIAAALMLLLAAVPGLPWFPFLVLGSVCGVTAHGLLRHRRQEAVAAGREVPAGIFEAFATEPEPREGLGQGGPPGLVEPIRLELSDAALPPEPLRPAERASVAGAEGRADVGLDADAFAREHVPLLRERLFARLGVTLPAVQVLDGAPDLSEGAYRISLKEVPLAEGVLPPDEALALASPSHLNAQGVDARPADLVGLEHGAAWIDRADTPAVEALGVRALTDGDILAEHLERILRRYAHELVGIQETRELLDALETTHAQLVAELVPKPVAVPLLAEVLGRLVEEGINIRHLADILPTLAGWLKSEKDPVLLTEYCRMALKRPITHQFAGGNGALAAVVLDPEIEQTVSESIQRSEAGSYLALEPELSREILEAAHRAVEPSLAAGEPAVVLTSMETRRFVRKLLEVDLPDVTVLSYQELSPDLEIRPVARIEV
jgi:type III secretion protein V